MTDNELLDSLQGPFKPSYFEAFCFSFGLYAIIARLWIYPYLKEEIDLNQSEAEKIRLYGYVFGIGLACFVLACIAVYFMYEYF